MPYTITKSNTVMAHGRVIGHHSNHAKATAQIRAIYANTRPGTHGKPATRSQPKKARR